MIPEKLIMEDFISHIKSEIDFSKFNSSLIIGTYEGNSNISNGSGKSSIFDAICFALYNKTRFNVKNKVVKRGKIRCKVEFIFSIDNESYKVLRILNKNSNLVSVNFYKLENNKWIDFGSDTPTMTTNKIIDIVGMSYDTFVNSIYFRQSDIMGFAGSTAGKRKEILKEILLIDIWDDFQNITKDEEKILINNKKSFINRLEEIGNIDNEKDKNIQYLSDITNNIEYIDNKILILEKELKEIDNVIVENNYIDYESDLEKISKRLKEIIETRDKLKNEFTENNNIIKKNSDEIISLKKKLKLLSMDVIIIENDFSDKALSICDKKVNVKYKYKKYINVKNDLEEKDKKLDLCIIQLSQLNSLKPGNDCPICLTKFDNLNDVEKRRNDKKIFLEEQIRDRKNEVVKLKQFIKEYEVTLKKAYESSVEIEKLGYVISKLSDNILLVDGRNLEIKKICKELSSEWKELKEKRDRLNILNIDDTKEILKRKELIKNNIKKLSNDIIELSVKKGGLNKNIEILNNRISEKEVILSKINDISQKINIFSKLSKVFGKDGIQAIIMENITEDLRNYTNHILRDICSDPMSVDFITQSKNSSGKWKEDFEIVINMDNECLEFNDLSGGEQVRLSIAIRLALSKILTQRVGKNVNFLLLDEIDQALDAQGIEVLSEVIRILSNDIKILVITHNNIMKEKFEHVITVVKNSDGSMIK